MIKFDLTNIDEDEESEYLAKEILKLKEQNLTNNIDFEKAEIERQEVLKKLNNKNQQSNKKEIEAIKTYKNKEENLNF